MKLFPRLTRGKAPSGKRFDERKPRALIVEDDQAIRIIIRQTLNSAFQVETVSNGKSAINLMRQGFIPDLIVTDLDMPGIRGESFISVLKINEIYRSIPVFVVSGSADEAHTLNVDKVFAKPFDPRLLLTSAQRAMSTVYST